MPTPMPTPASFDEFFTNNRAYFVRCAEGQLGAAKMLVGASAEDVVQSVYVDLEGTCAARPDTWTRAYVSTCVRRAVGKLRDRARREQEARQQVAQPTTTRDDTGPLCGLDLESLRTTLNAWLKTLSPRQRDSVWLRYCEDRKPKDIAEILGTTAGHVSQFIKNGKARLRDIPELEDMFAAVGHDELAGGRVAAFVVDAEQSVPVYGSCQDLGLTRDGRVLGRATVETGDGFDASCAWAVLLLKPDVVGKPVAASWPWPIGGSSFEIHACFEPLEDPADYTRPIDPAHVELWLFAGAPA